MVAAGHDHGADRVVAFGLAQIRDQFLDERDAVGVAFRGLKKAQDADGAVALQTHQFGHAGLPQVPVQTGARFSAKALGPSIASLLA